MEHKNPGIHVTGIRADFEMDFVSLRDDSKLRKIKAGLSHYGMDRSSKKLRYEWRSLR